MKRISFFCCIFFQAWINVSAQSLPEGDYHANRDRNIDIVDYKSELVFDFKNKSIDGKSTIKFHLLTSDNSFSLDAVNMKFKEIKSATGQTLSYSIIGQTLRINLDKTYSVRDTLTAVISYSAHPNAGMYFLEDPAKAGQYFVYTYGEGGLHSNWLPIYNDVNDKFTSEVVLTVPAPYSAISNGRLLSSEKNAKGEFVFDWKQELPHPNYLITVYVGEFDKADLTPAFGTVPMSYWVPKGHLKEGAIAFKNTTKMVEFFSKRLGYQYPWYKYDQVAVPDYAIGAMEHTSVTGHRFCVLRDESAPVNFGPPDFDSYNDAWTSEATISHELAHHWFGDNLTCRNLSYIWLNESFATYCMMLWDEESLGQEALWMSRQDALDRYLAYVKKEHIIRPLEFHYYNAPGDMYNTEHTYFKGGIILHMLRNILGDDDFFRTLSYYLHKHEFSNVESRDFKMAIEEATGKNLDWFFDDWVYNGGHPVFEVRYDFLRDQKLLDIKISQIQSMVESQGVFKLPIEIKIATSKGIQKETVWAENKTDHFLISCDEKPLMVSCDGKGALVAEWRFNKSLDELIYQIKNDELPGQIRALRDAAANFPTNAKTLQTISGILAGQSSWGLKAEAALLLGELRTTESEKIVTDALKAPDYRIRKAAVIALRKFRVEFSEPILKNIIEKEAHLDVVGTAVVSLAKINSNNYADYIQKQIGRSSWYNEITIACLNAYEVMANDKLVGRIKPFTLEPYNRHVRGAALDAWKACSPTDPDLHRTLMDELENAPRDMQLSAIELLGKLHVASAMNALQGIAEHSGDLEIANAARTAMEEINRILESKK